MKEGKKKTEIHRLNRQHIVILTFILLFGFVIRWGVINYICGPPVASYPTMDEMNFRELADNILDYRTFACWTEGFYTVSTRAPIYPLLVASGYAISGSRSYMVPKVINLILDICNILLLFLLARRLFNIRTGLIAAGIYAFFGHAPYFMAISSPYTLGVTLFLLVAIALISLKDSYYLMTPALSLFYALLIHTRPVFLVALPFLFPAIWLQLSSKSKNNNQDSNGKALDLKRKLKWIISNGKTKCIKTIIPILLISLLCLPWGIRNYREHKMIIPVSIIAGWHIANNINFSKELSIQYLTDQLYAPECRNAKEADYFKLARTKFYKAFFSNPIEFIAFGLARLVYSWSPPMPFIRFFLPRAYVFPVKIYDGYILPLPDFEGFIYIFAASTLLALILLKRKIIKPLACVFYRIRGVIVILAGYSLVHVIGIPLIAYRFLIEPFLIIIFIGLIFSYASEYLASNREQTSKYEPVGKTNIITVYLAFFLLFAVLMVPFFHNPKPQNHTYFALLKPKEVLSYKQLREMQWNNLGNIKPGTRIAVQGVVRYIHQGFKYVKDDYCAKKDPTRTAARLFVRYGDKKNPLGIGDVRLNLKNDKALKAGDIIKAFGIAEAGLFKEIIIYVDNIQK